MALQAVANGGASGSTDEVGPPSASSSPRYRMKFLCSYGGKIMPRPVDGHLKYVGGETRVIAVPRDINYSELMKKLKSEFDGDMVLKYQVMPEDLDVLVSVRTNEDLKHMFDEYDRHGSEGTTKLRAFLFPSAPVVLENQNVPTDPHSIEQLYTNAINNTVRLANSKHPGGGVMNSNRVSFSISASNSPMTGSPEGSMADGMISQETLLLSSFHNSRLPNSMHRVHSSPTLYSHANNNASHHQTTHHFYQHHPQYYQHPQQQQQQQHHQHGNQSSRPPHEPRRLTPSSSFSRPDYARVPATFIPFNHYYPNMQGCSNVHNAHAVGTMNKHGYFDTRSPSPGNKVVE